MQSYEFQAIKVLRFDAIGQVNTTNPTILTSGRVFPRMKS